MKLQSPLPVLACSVLLIQLANADPIPPVTELSSASFTSKFEGNEIYDGSSFINSWSEVNPPNATKIIVGGTSNLRHNHINGGPNWLEGSSTGWDIANNGDWTYETRLKFNSNANGYNIWLGTDTDVLLLNIYNNRTEDAGADSFSVSHDNLDGLFHTFRIAHSSESGVYHVWRDGERLTPIAGAPYDNSSTNNQLAMGDPINNTFGDNFDVEIDYVRYDQTGAYLPTGADADFDGMTDAWEYLYFGDVTSGLATADADNDGSSNLDEFNADTSPVDLSSNLRIHSIEEIAENTFNITVPNTSLQRNYTLYQSSDLDQLDDWTAVSGQGPIIGTGGDLVFDVTTTEVKNFYRVEASRP